MAAGLSKLRANEGDLSMFGNNKGHPAQAADRNALWDGTVKKTVSFGASGADIAFQQYGATGSGIRVAVLDSGYHPHPDLGGANGNSRVVAGVSFVNDGNGTDDPVGHGTHVIGIVAGNGAASTGSQF